MHLSRKNYNIILFALLFIVILIYSSNNFNRIKYFINNIKNSFSNIPYDKENNKFRIIDIQGNKFIKPYENKVRLDELRRRRTDSPDSSSESK